MWIASVPAAAPALPGAAPAAAPSGEAAPFDEALDASLLQGQPVRETGAPVRQLFDQRALAAWLLAGNQAAAAVPAEAEASPSETGVEVDEDLDRAVELDGDAESEIAMDVLFAAPVPQQPVAEPTVEITEAGAVGRCPAHAGRDDAGRRERAGRQARAEWRAGCGGDRQGGGAAE